MQHNEYSGSYYNNASTQMSLCNPETTLWMGDLKPDWDAQFIKEAFTAACHTIVNVKMVNDRQGAKSSFCFVEFPDPDAARKAMLDLCGRSIPNETSKTKFNLSFANSPNQVAEHNLFVTNLSSSVDDAALYRVFGERYISCRGAKVYRQPDGSSREFGFVRFTDETDQQRALVEMNKHRLKGREMVLKLAVPKDRRNQIRDHRSYIEHNRGSRYNQNYNFQSRHSANINMPLSNVIRNSNISQGQTNSYLTKHGMAGYGTGFSGIPVAYNAQVLQGTQQYMVGSTMQYPSVITHPFNAQYRNNNSMIIPNDARHLTSYFENSLNPISVPNAPVPIYYESQEPMTPDEHNDLVISMSSDFLTSLESSRWNKISFPINVRPKELTSLLYCN